MKRLYFKYFGRPSLHLDGHRIEVDGQVFNQYEGLEFVRMFQKQGSRARLALRYNENSVDIGVCVCPDDEIRGLTKLLKCLGFKQFFPAVEKLIP